MILISHRGNIKGPNEVRENSPYYVMEALAIGFNVEIDFWVKDGNLYLGHDKPEYKINHVWLFERGDKLWIHCKNTQALEWCNANKDCFNYFWHEQDTATITSKGYMWVYPGKQPVKKSIAVMPEIYEDDISLCMGVCSDYIQNYI